MAKKSRLKKENSEAKKVLLQKDVESTGAEDDISEGVIIEGGSDNLHYGNTILGFDEGIVEKDSSDSQKNQNEAESKEGDNKE